MTTTPLHTDPGPFFELSATPMAVLHGDGSIARANAAFAAHLSERQLAGAPISSLWRASDRPAIEHALSRLSSEPSMSCEASLESSDGARRSFNVSFTRTAEGKVLLTAVLAPEMGANERLKLTCFERILQSGPVGYWVTDAQGIYTFNDGKAGEKLGIMPGALVGQSSLELWKDSDNYNEIVRSLKGEEIHTQSSVPGIDVEIWYLPIRDEAGALTGTVGFCIDVTAQKTAERQLREQLSVVEKQNATMQMFSCVLESAPMILWSVDATGMVTMLEGKGTEIMGMRPGDTLGQNAIEMYKDHPEIAGAIVRALGGEASRTVTTPLPGVHFDAWFTPLPGRDGDGNGVIGLCIDASERVRGERELRDKLALIQRQSATIRALATPIIRVWDEVLCLPVIGTVDSARTADMMQALLETIVREQARFAIVDLTGVEVVDTSTADHLIQLFRAAKVLGVDSILCGIRPAVAQTVVALGLDLGSVRTMRTLRDALKWCIRSRGEPQQVAMMPARVALPGMPANTNAQGYLPRASGGEP